MAYFGEELGGVDFCRLLVGQLGPCGIHIETRIFVAAVHGGEVLVHYVLAFLTVALHDEFLHLLNGQIHGDNLGDAEECALQNGVGAVAQSDFLRDFGCVDVVNGDIVLGEVLLDVVGKMLGQLVAVPYGVEHEGAAVAQTAGYVVHVQIRLYMASHEVGGVHQIGAADGLVAEAKVRAGEAAALLGVVGEICLAVFVGVVADNLHRVLVGTHCTVGTETVELGFECAGVAHGNFGKQGQGSEGYIVHDTQGEVVLGHGKREVFVNCLNLRGSGVFRSQTVAAAYNHWGVFAAVICFFHIEI